MSHYLEERESYYDYMGRRMREEDAKSSPVFEKGYPSYEAVNRKEEPTVNEMLKTVLDRLEKLEKKVDAYLHNQGH